MNEDELLLGRQRSWLHLCAGDMAAEEGGALRRLGHGLSPPENWVSWKTQARGSPPRSQQHPLPQGPPACVMVKPTGWSWITTYQLCNGGQVASVFSPVKQK